MPWNSLLQHFRKGYILIDPCHRIELRGKGNERKGFTQFKKVEGSEAAFEDLVKKFKREKENNGYSAPVATEAAEDAVNATNRLLEAIEHEANWDTNCRQTPKEYKKPVGVYACAGCKKVFDRKTNKSTNNIPYGAFTTHSQCIDCTLEKLEHTEQMTPEKLEELLRLELGEERQAEIERYVQEFGKKSRNGNKPQQ